MSDATRRGWWGIALLAIIAGCGAPEETTTVEGIVSYQGEPISPGSIRFFPADGGRALGSGLDADGGYSVKLPPGDYDVTVQATVDLPEGFQEGDPIPPPSVRLPAKYDMRAKSVLKATVTEGQSEPIDFQLK